MALINRSIIDNIDKKNINEVFVGKLFINKKAIYYLGKYIEPGTVFICTNFQTCLNQTSSILISLLNDKINYQMNYFTIDSVFENLHIVDLSNQSSLKNKYFVFIGNLNHSKEIYKKIIALHSWVFQTCVTKETTTIITPNVNSNVGKIKRAKETGIEVLSEDQLLSLFS